VSEPEEYQKRIGMAVAKALATAKEQGVFKRTGLVLVPFRKPRKQ